jgi:hypothetical protein
LIMLFPRLFFPFEIRPFCVNMMMEIRNNSLTKKFEFFLWRENVCQPHKSVEPDVFAYVRVQCLWCPFVLDSISPPLAPREIHAPARTSSFSPFFLFLPFFN